MFRDVPGSSKILERYRKLNASGFRPLTLEMQAIIAEPEKPKKVGQKEQPIYNEEEGSARNKDVISNPKLTQTNNAFVSSPPPSPKTTTTTITVAPCPPPGSSQPQSTIPLSTPLYTDSTVPPTN
ncbi:unnamed protein product [Lactuca saligna]|uniref:Uncharacterized protein n=1 Tax=Lactuca saligna TaxID=75948 RepID=A0AA36EIQ6_LACSI|nr:unnamed protein product [Lactuca saligna]